MADPTPQTFDPLALWRGLHPAAQERLGALAIAHEVATQGSMLAETADAAYWRFEHAVDETGGEIEDLIVEALPDAFGAEGAPRHPDLNVLGIRQCAGCGCTDNHGCPNTCAWAAPTLCTTCTPPAKEA